MPLIRINDISAPELAPYASLTEAQLRSRIDPSRAIFIAESPKVIKVALDRGYVPLSLLAEERHILGDAAPIIARCPENMPVYTAARDTLAALTGYNLTRGVLCAMQRPAPLSPEQVTRGARRVAVIDGVTDTTNIGSIFRSAAAIGLDAVLLTPTSCDPLLRRSVRVSMGSVFLIPWAYLPQGHLPSQLRNLGLVSVALALTDQSVSIDDPRLKAAGRLAMILGTEGDGLARDVIEDADFTARIPMAHGVDSLNVAAASALAFWELRPSNS
ncbi:MAG: RNA methyltransferase [Pseudoflavonifractor sp.]|nr:RNA methyltransferase [Alloprevotella sp.]MCM1116114.1 RNA methyltransferase [Pseudoflavonifractor sp.]